MSVLIEAISVVLRRDAVEERYLGGWEAFAQHVPNATLCTDGRLVRVGFMGPPDAQAFIADVESNGLRFLVDGVATDLAVVDQQQGPLNPCRWLGFGRLVVEGGTVAVCWRSDGNDGNDGSDESDGSDGSGGKVGIGGAAGPVATPAGWTFEGSLSQHFRFVPTDEVAHRLQLLRRDEHGQDVYLDLDTGREIYIARTTEEDEDH